MAHLIPLSPSVSWETVIFMWTLYEMRGEEESFSVFTESTIPLLAEGRWVSHIPKRYSQYFFDNHCNVVL